MYQWFHDQKRIFLVLEFAAKGEMYKVLQREKRFDDKTAAKVLFDLFIIINIINIIIKIIIIKIIIMVMIIITLFH